MNSNTKGAVVILEGKQPVGILTERDVVGLLYKGCRMDEPIRKYSIKPLISANGDRTLSYALDLTIKNDIRRVVIEDKSKHFLGIVTQQDLLRYFEEDFYRLAIKVKHILKKLGTLLTVSPGDTLSDVLRVISREKISAVAVVKNRKAVGIITEKDILRLASKNVSLKSRVKDHMTSPAITATLDTALVDVVEMMNARNIRRVIINNHEGLAINMVTIRDVIRNIEKDISKFVERKLKSAKDILNMLPEMLIEVTDTGKEQLIIWANEKVFTRFGIEIIDKSAKEFFPKAIWNKVYSSLVRFNRIEEIRFKKDNEVYELSGFLISTGGKAEKRRLQLILRDITEEVRMFSVDPLTSVYNRRFINGFLIKEIGRSKRADTQFSIVMCDLDDFKKINDTYGHPAGDAVLKSLSELITAAVREQDVVGRYGGDEFVIVLPEATKEITSHIIDRLRLRIENHKISLPNGQTIRVTASFGVSTYPEDSTASDDLIIKSDERLYKAKSLGKNRVAYS
jgi:diguanylate cyclase (GGDEF)-like protein